MSNGTADRSSVMGSDSCSIPKVGSLGLRIVKSDLSVVSPKPRKTTYEETHGYLAAEIAIAAEDIQGYICRRMGRLETTLEASTPRVFVPRSSSLSMNKQTLVRLVSLPLASAIAGGAFVLAIIARSQGDAACYGYLSIGLPALGVAAACVLSLLRDRWL